MAFIIRQQRPQPEPAPAVLSGPAASVSSLVAVVICAVCELSGQVGDAAEARYLVSVHDRLHHGGPQWAPALAG